MEILSAPWCSESCFGMPKYSFWGRKAEQSQTRYEDISLLSLLSQILWDILRYPISQFCINITCSINDFLIHQAGVHHSPQSPAWDTSEGWYVEGRIGSHVDVLENVVDEKLD